MCKQVAQTIWGRLKKIALNNVARLILLIIVIFCVPICIGVVVWNKATLEKYYYSNIIINFQPSSESKHPEPTFKNLSCVPVFASIEGVLIISFIFFTVVALYKYLETGEFWTIKEYDKDLPRDNEIFDELAKRHKKLSQLWFTISLAIVCGGLIYAAFHVMKVPCAEVWGFSYQGGWVEYLVHFIPNLFLYSIFFVGYMWSLKNYKAHWHNFVTNEHRYASLVAIEKIREKKYNTEILKQLDMQSAVVVLIPSETAYLEDEGEREITAAERLLKIEEAIRELVTQGKK